MATIPLASTSRAVFAPSSTAASRLLGRQLVLQAGAVYAAGWRPISSSAASTSAITQQRQQQQLHLCRQHNQPYHLCRRHAHSTPKGRDNRNLPEETRIYPNTGLGGANTESNFFAKTHTNLGGGGGKSLLSPETGAPLTNTNIPSKRAGAVLKKKGAGGAVSSQEMEWMSKHLRTMDKNHNIKLDYAAFTDEDLPFALYVPPTSVPFRPFSEQWLVYWWGRAVNAAQSFRALKDVFGVTTYFKNKKKIVKDRLIPVYESVCKARTTGVYLPIRNDISLVLARDFLAAQRKLSTHFPNAHVTFKWHGLKSVDIVTARQVEWKKDKATAQVTLRISSLQTMEVRNDKGELVAGDHGKPKLVTENFVFQKKVSEGKDAPWIAVRSIPTLSPLQAVGEKDERLLKVTNREKKTAITVVA